MWKRFAAVAILAALLAVGCSKGAEPVQTPAAGSAQNKPMVNVTVKDLQALITTDKKPLIVDVRTPEEYAAGHIEGAKLVPLQTLEKDIAGIKKDQEIYLICRSGNRSAQAYTILAGMGYKDLKNVTGGMIEWEKAGYKIVK